MLASMGPFVEWVIVHPYSADMFFCIEGNHHHASQIRRQHHGRSQRGQKLRFLYVVGYGLLDARLPAVSGGRLPHVAACELSLV